MTRTEKAERAPATRGEMPKEARAGEARATGTVIRHAVRGSAVRGSGVAVYRLVYPVVRFETREGGAVEFESGLGSNMPPRVGQEVGVIYDPSQPRKVRMVLGSAIRPRRRMLLVGAGIVILALPVFLALAVVLLAAAA